MALREHILRFDKLRTSILKNRILLALVLLWILVWLAGCGGGVASSDEPVPVFSTQILSDQAADGDIAFRPPAAFEISSSLATGSVLAGIDPDSGDEFRGFLDFPLRGVHGVPLGADIESATLEIFIDSLTIPFPDRTLPYLIDLVSFQPPALITADFDRNLQPPLLTMPFDFLPSDAGAFVVIDVTALMDQAQLEGLPDFQLRFLLDYIAAAGLVEIDDGAASTAPLLTVTYFFK